MKGLITIGLLLVSNTFMTLAWYGHLKFGAIKGLDKLGFVGIVFLSWSIALLEYFCLVPANRIGFAGNGGPFSLFQLKVIQEVISLVVFTLFAVFCFRTETFRWNHLVGFCLLVLAVYFFFRK